VQCNLRRDGGSALYLRSAEAADRGLAHGRQQRHAGRTHGKAYHLQNPQNRYWF
jgi:hypothetical protein